MLEYITLYGPFSEETGFSTHLLFNNEKYEYYKGQTLDR